MKKVIVIGATGSLAEYVIQAIKDVKDVQLTLFVRNKNRLSKEISEECDLIQGDAIKYDNVTKAIAAQEIVYVNLAGNFEAMTKNIVRAMQENNVQRIIAISSIGIYDKPVKPVLVPYRRLTDVIESSSLDYTILRPDWFTNDNEIHYILTRKGEPKSGTAISIKSITTFIKTIIENPDLYKNENLSISKPD